MSRQQGFSLDGYVDVAERVREFRAKHPEGSLQPANKREPYRVEAFGDDVFIVYTAAAYRTPDDRKPGIGCAWERFPGKTAYTRDSELQNAETSAWGRAIVAALAADTQKIASAQEVRNRQEPEPERKATKQQQDDIGAKLRDLCDTDAQRSKVLEKLSGKSRRAQLTFDEAMKVQGVLDDLVAGAKVLDLGGPVPVIYEAGAEPFEPEPAS